MSWLKSFVLSFFIFFASVFGLGENSTYIHTPPNSKSATAPQSSIPPATLNITRQTASTTATQILWTWKTYTNAAYGFSIGYQCAVGNSECSPFPSDAEQDYKTTSMVLPPSPGGTQLTVLTFTDQSVAGAENSYGPFPFTLNSLRAALQLSVNTRCELTEADEATTTACIVTDVAGNKAIEVAGYTIWDGNYYISVRKGQYIEIDPLYSDADIHPTSYYQGYDWPGYLSRQVKIPATLQNEIDAVSEQLSTLRIIQ